MTPAEIWSSPAALRGRAAAAGACADLLSAVAKPAAPTVRRSSQLQSLLARPDLCAWPEWFREWLWSRVAPSKPSTFTRADLGLTEAG